MRTHTGYTSPLETLRVPAQAKLAAAARRAAKGSDRPTYDRAFVPPDPAAATVADFAALVFAYTDELSAASVAGHTAELAAAGRARARHLTELGHGLLTGEPADVLLAKAERAQWAPPSTLTAVVLPAARVHDATALLDARTLVLTDDLADGPVPAQTGVLLVPDVAPGRTDVFRQLRGRAAIVGPTRPWTRVSSSFDRAVRVLALTHLIAEQPSTPRTGSPPSSSAPTRMRSPTCARRSSHRWPICDRRPPSGWRRRCGRGCFTRADAVPSPSTSSCTLRRCATA